MRTLLVVAILVAVALGAPRLLEPSSRGARVERVVDGDTLVVRVNGREETVRLIGIDTPERSECGYEAATEVLERLADGRSVRLVEDPSQDRRDRYDRLLRYVEVAGEDVAEEILRRGLAEVYVFERPFARVADYRAAVRPGRDPCA